MNKNVYLGLSILEIKKIAMYDFWYHYIELKYKEKARLCYMDIEIFIVYIKTEDIYIDIAKDIETRSDTSNYGLERPLPKGKSYWINEKWIRRENNENLLCWEQKHIAI